MDPDKVYEKQKFTAAYSEESRLQVKKVFNNINQYKKGLFDLRKERKEIADEVQKLNESDPNSQNEVMEAYSKLWALDMKQSLYDGFRVENSSSSTIKDTLEKLSDVFSKIEDELKRIKHV